MNHNQTYDFQTVEVMKRVLINGGNCIDIGCHAGVMMDEMLKIAPQGSHCGFEPLPDLFKDLSKKYYGAPNVLIHNLALCDSTGTVTFQHVVSNPGFSCLKQRRYERLD